MALTPDEVVRFTRVATRLNAMARSFVMLGDSAAAWPGIDAVTLDCYTHSLKRIAAAQLQLAEWGRKKVAGAQAGQVGGETLNKGADRRPM